MYQIEIKKSTQEKTILALGEKCNKCGKCCSYGSGFVLESEIPRIAAFLNIPKEKFVKEFLEEIEIFHTIVYKIKPVKKTDKVYGKCMFLENNLCRIHEIKPLHCKIGNCGEQGEELHVWFLLNYCLNIYDPESVRQYNSYVKTGGKIIPGGELEELFPDKEVLERVLSYSRFR